MEKTQTWLDYPIIEGDWICQYRDVFGKLCHGLFEIFEIDGKLHCRSYRSAAIAPVWRGQWCLVSWPEEPKISKLRQRRDR